MPAYVVADVRAIRDEAKLARYRAAFAALLERSGGRRLAASGAVTVLAGDWLPGQLVIFEYPSVEAILASERSPEYELLRRLRDEAVDVNIVVVPGLQG